VLSWELAEQLVVVDFLRGGLLEPSAPLSTTESINPAPFRAINPLVYNGLPVELRAAIGGPLADQGDPGPTGTDGRATVLNVAVGLSAPPRVVTQEFDIAFGQVIPKPFCASGPFDALYVQGPVHLRQVTILTSSENYLSSFHARGRLDLTPVNPLSDPPTAIGTTYERRSRISAIRGSCDTGIEFRVAARDPFQRSVPRPSGRATRRRARRGDPGIGGGALRAVGCEDLLGRCAPPRGAALL
jgi:hypothetical protein